MFATVAFFAVVLFGLAVVGLPFRFQSITSRWIEKIRAQLLCRATCSVFAAGEDKSGERLVKARAWGVTAFVLMVFFLLSMEKPFQDHPAGFFRVAMAILGAVASTLGLAFCFEMVCSFLPALRAFGLLSRFGFRALWVLEPGRTARGLREALVARVRGSSRVAILDVTGQELIGKGAGPSGGVLYDTLASMVSVPVQLLLLQPETISPDPEQRRATAFQSVLAEMDITPQNFVRRIRATLDAVQTLNELRAETARIDVRFYTEKPSFRAIVFDGTSLVAPWVPRESNFPSPFLEVGREAAEPTLYNSFRFQFARLWASAAPRKEAEARSNGFKSVVVRREATAVQS